MDAGQRDGLSSEERDRLQAENRRLQQRTREPGYYAWRERQPSARDREDERRPTTTTPPRRRSKPADRVRRDFSAAAPDRLWVGDVTTSPIGGSHSWLGLPVGGHSVVAVGWGSPVVARKRMSSAAVGWGASTGPQ